MMLGTMEEPMHTGEYEAVPSLEDFASAWASKCEELARETAKVTALIGVIRGVVEATRPGTTKEQREAAHDAVRAITLVDAARSDEDFMDRLARVRERYETRVDVPDGFVLVSTAYDPPGEPEPVNEYGTPLGLALEDQSIRDEEKAERG
jgi:hypothetical protein